MPATTIGSRGLRALCHVAAVVAVLTACATHSPNDNEDASPMDINDLPNLRQTQTELLALIEGARLLITGAAPSATHWRWSDRYGAGSCHDDAGNKGIMLFFPDLYTEHGLTPQEWDRAIADITELAADAGLTEVATPGDTDTNHDARFYSDDGRELMVGSLENTVISARVTCRRDDDSDPIEMVDGRIVMPPQPE